MASYDEIDRREFLSKCARGGLGALLGCGLGGGLLASAVPAEAAIGNVAWHPARFWQSQSGNTIMCQLCPRRCVLGPNQYGDCKARVNVGGQLISLTYGKPTAIHGDPIEKAPFFHFLPGSETLAVGTAG
ncbi:MAG: radical SAM protein, partial [Armatimonadetes bacterium]|nr:radical SAM protein [Armatimonadota bacterium]